MSTANAYLTVAGIGVDVTFKDIRNLHISVYPPKGSVRVAAPDRMDEDTIRRAVIQRLPWIKRQRDELQKAEPQEDLYIGRTNLQQRVARSKQEFPE